MNNPQAPDHAASLDAMLVGLTVPADQYGRLLNYPGVSYCRVYGPPGSGWPKWRPGGRLDTLPADIIPWCSAKDWGTDVDALAALDEHLAANPGRFELLTLHHEAEGDAGITETEQRRRYFVTAEHLAGSEYARLADLVAVQNGWWTVHRNGGDPSTYWPGFGLPAMDIYASHGPYPHPADLFAPIVRLSVATGRRFYVTEWGAELAPDDPTGQYRADWIYASTEYLRDNGCAGVGWFDALGSTRPDGTRPDYRLDDTASRAAYADVVRGVV